MASDSGDIVKSCAISSNLETYPNLIDEMQGLFGDGWGGLDVDDAISVLRSNHAQHMESVVIAIGAADEQLIPEISKIIETAKLGGLRTIVVTQDISATSLHTIMRSGADDFLPYPLPNGGLQNAIFQNATANAEPLQTEAMAPVAEPVPAAPAPIEPEPAPAPMVMEPAAAPPVAEQPEPAPQPAAPTPLTLETKAAPQPEQAAPVQTHNFAKPIMAEAPAQPEPAQPAPVAAPAAEAPAAAPQADAPAPSEAALEQAPAAPSATPTVSTTKRGGTVFPVLGMAGGVGATTFCVNLAWELQNVLGNGGRACVLDLGLQYGSVATYLDTARTDATFELFTSIDVVDAEGFTQALSLYRDTLAILPAPPDAAPLELLNSGQVARLIDLASSQFDYVFIDLPPALVSWTETLLDKADLMFALCELDMRTAQNSLRFLRALKADDLPYEKVQFILNNAPKMTDLSGRSRIKRMADSLNIEFRWMLPDGGKHVINACDQGDPLALTSARNPLRKEIRKIAENLINLSNEAPTEAKQQTKGQIEVRA